MATKPFLTFDKQIEKLKKRNLVIEDENHVKRILARENYYNVINGYKIPFLKKDINGNLITPETYIDECNFNEIYSLHNMDRDLRIHLLSHLLKFETHLKTNCAYVFSDKHRESYAYLNICNYSTDKNDLSNVLKNLAALSSEVNKSVGRNNKSLYIGHYINKHDSVPLWVLVNSLTMGNMSYFYNSLDLNLRESIAKNFSIQYKSSYNSHENISSGELKNLIKAVNLFRNVCAHEEILYIFKLKKGIKTKIFEKYFKSSSIGHETLSKNDLYTLIAILKLVLIKDDYLDLIEGIKKIFEKYENDFKTVKFEDIILLAGFTKDWKEKICNSIF